MARQHEPDCVAIIVPVLNEAHYIETCLTTLLGQAAAIGASVLVMDGGSTDGTQKIVQRLQAAHPRLALHHNPKRLQSAAMNLAARILPPEVTVLIRADAHAGYPGQFCRTCSTALRTNDATSVVVPLRTIGGSGTQRAVAAVQNSRLGNGGSAHRGGGVSGPVDHGHHAAFDRAFYDSLGGYDESFSHNEDAELDERARRAGGTVWMCRDAVVEYYPRTRLTALARQYYNHGKGRVRTLLKHRITPRPRQLAAPAILAGCAGGALLAPLSIWFTAFPTTYVLGCLTWACCVAVRRRDLALLAIAPAAMAVHLGWGFGFYAGLAAAARHRRLFPVAEAGILHNDQAA